MATPRSSNGFEGRVSSLETSVANLHVEIGDIRRVLGEGFAEIRNAQNSHSRTNWPLVISGCMAIASLYAAAVAPIKGDVSRLEAATERLAGVDAVQSKIIADQQVLLGINGARLSTTENTVLRIDTLGSPITDKRLAVIEYVLGRSGAKK